MEKKCELKEFQEIFNFFVGFRLLFQLKGNFGENVQSMISLSASRNNNLVEFKAGCFMRLIAKDWIQEEEINLLSTNIAKEDFTALKSAYTMLSQPLSKISPQSTYTSEDMYKKLIWKLRRQARNAFIWGLNLVFQESDEYMGDPEFCYCELSQFLSKKDYLVNLLTSQLEKLMAIKDPSQISLYSTMCMQLFKQIPKRHDTFELEKYNRIITEELNRICTFSVTVCKYGQSDYYSLLFTKSVDLLIKFLSSHALKPVSRSLKVYRLYNLLERDIQDNYFSDSTLDCPRENILQELKQLIPQTLLISKIWGWGCTLDGGFIVLHTDCFESDEDEVKIARIMLTLYHELAHKKKLHYQKENIYNKSSGTAYLKSMYGPDTSGRFLEKNGLGREINISAINLEVALKILNEKEWCDEIWSSIIDEIQSDRSPRRLTNEPEGVSDFDVVLKKWMTETYLKILPNCAHENTPNWL